MAFTPEIPIFAVENQDYEKVFLNCSLLVRGDGGVGADFCQLRLPLLTGIVYGLAVSACAAMS